MKNKILVTILLAFTVSCSSTPKVTTAETTESSGGFMSDEQAKVLTVESIEKEIQTIDKQISTIDGQIAVTESRWMRENSPSDEAQLSAYHSKKSVLQAQRQKLEIELLGLQ